MVIIWSRLTGMKFWLVLPGSWQCYKFSVNYILWFHVKSFIPARWDPSFILPESRFAGTKFSHVITSARLSGMKKLISTSVWKNSWKHILIDRSYFYCIFTTHMMSICKKKSKQMSLQNSIILWTILNQSINQSINLLVFVDKYQVETCPALPEWKLISPCNRSVKSVPVGRVEISSRQNRIMYSPPNTIPRCF